jgi:DNA-binding SARP family transcriptional activator
MDLLLIPETQLRRDVAESLSITSLLERGIAYFRQEHYAEGMALFRLAREYLIPDHNMNLTAILDTLMQEYERYSHLQQTLQEASFRLGELNIQLQVNITGARTLQSQLLTELDNEQTSPVVQEYHLLKETSLENAVAHPRLYATCLAPFRLSCLDGPLALCSNRNGQALLRYLIAQPDHSATADTLMALFWPEDSAEVALRKLHVTVSILRRSLQTGYDIPGGYILYKQHVYQLNPALALRSDVEEFLDLYHEGCKAQEDVMASFYERACALYTRPFLMEDLYADWSFTRREQLRQIHLSMCSALATYYLETHSYEKASRWAVTIIEGNPCDESAYRQLMRLYAMQGRRNDALRQYQRCQQVLFNELGMQPMPETVSLYQAIIRGEL